MLAMRLSSKHANIEVINNAVAVEVEPECIVSDGHRPDIPGNRIRRRNLRLIHIVLVAEQNDDFVIGEIAVGRRINVLDVVGSAVGVIEQVIVIGVI